MIRNAKDVPLTANSGTLPDMGEVLTDWFVPLTFTKVIKKQVEYQTVEATQEYAFMGVKQPMSAQQLQMKPEGQRAWIWHTVHAYPDLILNPDEIIFFGPVQYRVMGKLDWKEYGYVEYHLVQDYQA